MSAMEIGMPEIEITAAKQIEDIKSQEGSVYTDPLRATINFRVTSSLDGKTQEQKEQTEKIKDLLTENKSLFTEREFHDALNLPDEKGILCKTEIELMIKQRKETEQKYTDLCNKYDANFSKNKKWQNLRLEQKLDFLEKIKKLISALEKHAKEKSLITNKRIGLTMKNVLETFDENEISTYLEKIKKLFEKESLDVHIFDQASQIKGLPYPVKKMSDASKKFYLEYYTEEDFTVRMEIIKDWETIVEHEEKLLQKFMDIFSDYPDKLPKKLADFKDLDFTEKESFLKNAEILFPPNKKTASRSTEENKEKSKSENEKKPQKPEIKEVNEKEVLEKECINKALDAMKMEKPEQALSILLAFKKANGLTPKIKFHIKTVLSYIQEIELKEEEEKKTEENTKIEKAKKEKARISRMIEDIFSGMALKRLIKQERLVAKNIRGAMKNEALHKGEKDALKRSQKENLQRNETDTDEQITKLFYENEKDYLINEGGKAKRLNKIRISKDATSMDKDEIFKLSKDEEDLNKAVSEKGKGTSSVNFYNAQGELISAKTAMDTEKSKVEKVSHTLSQRMISDLHPESSPQKIDLKAIIEARLSREIGIS